jgi:hypothetical protein
MIMIFFLHSRSPTRCWTGYIQWRSKRAGRKELEQSAGHAANLGALGWMIARDGFTPEALNYARQACNLTSSGEDLDQLAKMLKSGERIIG